MKHNIVFSFILLFLCISVSLPVFGQSSEIVLSDGTVIYGTVVGMNDGVYSIKTGSMGTVKIDSDKVISISKKRSNNSRSSRTLDIIDNKPSSRRTAPSYGRSQNSSNSYGSMQEQANQRVQSMVMNENFLDSLFDLSENSAMTDVMNDPEIMNAISTGDYDFLMNSEKMKGLMDSDAIQNLLGGFN